MTSSVSDINRAIRDLINEPRLNAIVRADRAKFNQLCSALDLIADTEYAIDAYSELSPDIDLGLRYLALYGLWQAFQQQQDAVMALADAVGVPVTKAWRKRASTVRRMRSAVVGHPVNTTDSGKRMSHQVSQITLRTSGFDLLSHADDGTYDFQSVDVIKYATNQRQLIEEALVRIETELHRMNTEHRKAFADVKFVALLDKVGYPLEKVMVGPDDPSGPQFVLGNVKALESAVASFRAELDRRGIGAGTYDGTERCLAEIDYALAQLHAYYEGVEGEVQSDRAARVFASYAHEMFDDLRGMARELDEEYELED